MSEVGHDKYRHQHMLLLTYFQHLYHDLATTFCWNASSYLLVGVFVVYVCSIRVILGELNTDARRASLEMYN